MVTININGPVTNSQISVDASGSVNFPGWPPEGAVDVGFTGTQRGMTRRQQLRLEGLVTPWAVGRAHHGDCVGADKQFHSIMRRLGWWMVGHLPLDDRKRAFCDFDEMEEPQAYDVRNEAIVHSVAVMFATPAQEREQRRSGTWMTIRRAWACQRARRAIDERLILCIIWLDGGLMLSDGALNVRVAGVP